MSLDVASLDRVGLVAGRGHYPLMFCDAARRRGKAVHVVAFHGETEPEIAAHADTVTWLYVGQLAKTIKAFTSVGCGHVVFAGQIKPGRLLNGDMRPDLRVIKLLARLRSKNADTIFGGMCAEFARDGVTVLPAITYLEDSLASPGQLGRVKPDKGTLADIELGGRMARETARLRIGQTVVVKDGVVLAVEAFEGTDKAILRGGELSRGGGVTVVKVARPGQDLRYDVPCIGLRTVEMLLTAKARALAVQAGLTLFIDRAAVLAALDKAKIAVFGLDLAHGADSGSEATPGADAPFDDDAFGEADGLDEDADGNWQVADESAAPSTDDEV